VTPDCLERSFYDDTGGVIASHRIDCNSKSH